MSMSSRISFFGIKRRAALAAVAALLAFPFLPLPAFAQGVPSADPLPSWNEGPTKTAIMTFVKETTDPASPKFVPPAERIATFDQDGTLWVEQPMVPQIVYAFDQLPAVVKAKPELAEVEPFKTALSGNREAIAKLTLPDLEKILAATLTGMSVETFQAEVKKWLDTTRDARWKRPPTELTYQPMQEVLKYLRASGYKTYIVTGGGQDFVRVFAERVYGIPPEQVVGSMAETKFGYDKDGKPFLTKEPRLVLNDDKGGKPEAIHMMIGRRPVAAFGNSTGDREMLEYTKAGDGARLAMLVLHDDAVREYAYGSVQGLPPSRIGPFTQELSDEAKKDGWVVISIKSDWKRIFAFEQQP
jgi:phosphoglycolate phosphatase-like HAD superfamily hydrolase